MSVAVSVTIVIVVVNRMLQKLPIIHTAVSAQEATTSRADIKTAGRLCISIALICLLPRLHSQGKQ